MITLEVKQKLNYESTPPSPSLRSSLDRPAAAHHQRHQCHGGHGRQTAFRTSKKNELVWPYCHTYPGARRIDDVFL